MSVAVCLLATSLFTCEWHRPGTAPRLQPKPIEISAEPPAEYKDPFAKRLPIKPIEVASLPAAGLPQAEQDDSLAARFPAEDEEAAIPPDAAYSETVTDRIGLAAPDPERFGEVDYAALPPAVYGDYPEPPTYRNEREKRRAERKAKREMQTAVKEFKVEKTKAVISEEAIGYAAPAERKSWLASLFNSDVQTSVPRVKGIDPSKEGYREVIKAAREHGVPVDLALRVAKQESGGNCSVTSGAGAGGVMQVMPKTAAKHGVTRFKNIYDCRTGAQTGVRELKHLLELSDGDVKQTLIGYNCGERCMNGKRKKLPAETVNYVASITAR